MESCSKKGAGAASALPDDPLVEILSRVPAKSICRFKCVSKAWRDLIADPDHRKKLRQAMQGLFLEACEYSEVDYTKLACVSFNFIDLAVRSVPLDVDSSFSFLREMTGIHTFLLDSCKGLLLFGQRQEQSQGFDGYIVCNPTTRQWSAVPACGPRAALNRTYLAFDPAVSSHFHLVEFQMPDLYEDVVSLLVYSSETGTWSQNLIDEQKEQGHLEGWHHQFTLAITKHRWATGAFVNGFLHLIVCGSDIQHILAVDVQGKARRMITVPGMTDGRHEVDFVCYFGQSQERLHCITKSEMDKLSTWVLQDYDTQEWVLKNTMHTLDVFGETQEMPEFRVVGIHQDCNVVFFFHEWSGQLIAYNMDRNEVSVIATFKDDKFRSKFARYIPYFSESLALTNKY